MKNFRHNDQIRAKQVRLIDESGEHIGIVHINEARDRARSANLDLVEINGDVNPPVAKIIDYGKFKYESSKKEKEQKKKQRESRIEIKELWLRPVTDDHDIEIKLNKAKKFIENGNQVKFGMRFKGREIGNMKDYIPSMNGIIEKLEADVVTPVTIQNRTLITVIGPKKG